MYLNQFSTDTAAHIPSPRKVIGLDSIVAHTKLFTRKEDVVDEEELSLPAYMDRNGTVLEEVRRKGFCYTQENDVEYAEITGTMDFSYVYLDLTVALYRWNSYGGTVLSARYTRNIA